MKSENRILRSLILPAIGRAKSSDKRSSAIFLEKWRDPRHARNARSQSKGRDRLPVLCVPDPEASVLLTSSAERRQVSADAANKDDRSGFFAKYSVSELAGRTIIGSMPRPHNRAVMLATEQHHIAQFMG